MAKIDAKMLKGLKFRGANSKEVEKDGRKTIEYVAFERDLSPSDVLASKDYGDHLVIVTADGRKYQLPKPKPASGGKED